MESSDSIHAVAKLVNNQLTPLILVVESHWLVGKLRRTADQRVLDMLVETASDYLNLEDVKVFSSFDRKNCLTTLPTMVVPKDRLHLAIIPTDRFEVPRKQRVHKIVNKIQLESSAVAAGYLVQGTLHLNCNANSDQHVLSDLLGRFFPITAATIFGPGGDPVQASTVLANKDFVSSISCGEAEPNSPSPATTNSSAASPHRPGDSIAGQLLVDAF
ncbi:MAG: hypothetical protein HON53_21780 [Planctomycetaceae bacterium]|jgi:hypothetical protein|nr:hypothetical protein [Planctomycetaceae bacterium]MBT6155016.1 hypothetical protein [Planctomycetaceae bacterium]MBT6493033.1 hypothetical protein [Planctomycetaceae bacterium]